MDYWGRMGIIRGVDAMLLAKIQPTMGDKGDGGKGVVPNFRTASKHTRT
jgi:hypothetical protein